MLVRVWDVDTGQVLRETRRSAAELALDRKGHRLAMADSWTERSRIVVLDVATGKEIGWDAAEGRVGCRGVAFSPDGGRLAATLWTAPGGASELVVCDVASGGLRRLGQAHGRPEFSHDGTRLAARLSPERMAIELGVWDVETGRQLMVLRGHEGCAANGMQTGLAFSPAGDRIVSTAHLAAPRAVEVRIWDGRPYPANPPDAPPRSAFPAP
jgi:WD40 repeat protein